MPFALTKSVLGYKLFIAISEEEYQAISNAKKKLLEALYLEEKLDIVIENYLEFEMELLASSTRQMVNRGQNYSWFQEEINKLNRRVVNLLSAGRLYLDHSMHHLSNMYGDKSEHIETIKKYRSEEYDLKLGFRVMEAMRNYVQHRGFPIQRWSYNAKRIEKKDKFQLLFTLTPFIIVEELRGDKKFKKSVIDELEEIGKEIDIKPLVREYIAGIANFHEKVRLVMVKDVLSWEKMLFTCIDKFKEKTSPEESVIGLSAVITGDRGTYRGVVPIFTEFIEHRRELEKKNKTLSTLGIRYVTSEII
jgi:hypothetical protein